MYVHIVLEVAMTSNTIKHQQNINYMNKIMQPHCNINTNMPILSALEILVGMNAMEAKPFAIS